MHNEVVRAGYQTAASTADNFNTFCTRSLWRSKHPLSSLVTLYVLLRAIHPTYEVLHTKIMEFTTLDR